MLLSLGRAGLLAWCVAMVVTVLTSSPKPWWWWALAITLGADLEDR